MENFVVRDKKKLFLIMENFYGFHAENCFQLRFFCGS